MRMLTAAAGAALLILAAGPTLAGDRDPRGGGHPGGGCGGGCGGGGHPGGRNINVNVNANASAFAGASASSFLNARAYNVGSVRGGAVGGGTVYVGGGYGGDMGGYYGGGAVYNERPSGGRACASAPFGYVVSGFGRDERRPPACGGVYYDDRDRGGRYGYSERHEGYAESRYESRESYSEYEAYEGGWYGEEGHARRDDRRERRDDDAFEAREYDRGYMEGRRDCDCGPDGRDGSPYVPAPEPAYAPPYEPPVYEPPVYAPPPVYEAPMTPNQYYGVGDQSPPPRQYYRQEPGERG